MKRPHSLALRGQVVTNAVPATLGGRRARMTRESERLVGDPNGTSRDREGVPFLSRCWLCRRTGSGHISA